MGIKLTDQERRDRIRLLVQAVGRVSVRDLVRGFVTSEDTIRGDLQHLESAGSLQQIPDGAIADAPAIEEPFDRRMALYREEKEAIARATVALISPGMSCFIDVGTTTSALAVELARVSGIYVITNSLLVARELRARGSDAKLSVLSGRLNEDVPGTCGALALREIEGYHVDLALVSPVGIQAQFGISYFHVDEADIARAMMAQADRTVILADRSKIGLASRHHVCPCDRIDLLITDAGAPEEGLARLKEAGLRSIVAAPL